MVSNSKKPSSKPKAAPKKEAEDDWSEESEVDEHDDAVPEELEPAKGKKKNMNQVPGKQRKFQ